MRIGTAVALVRLCSDQQWPADRLETNVVWRSEWRRMQRSMAPLDCLGSICPRMDLLDAVLEWQ